MYSVDYVLDNYICDETGTEYFKTLKEAVKFASSIVRWGIANGSRPDTSYADVFNKRNEFIISYNGR